MTRRSLLVLASLAACALGLARAETPVLVEPWPHGVNPSVAPAGDGVMMVWKDYRDGAEPGQPSWGLRSALFDRDGNSIGGQIRLWEREIPYDHWIIGQLERVAVGYVYVFSPTLWDERTNISTIGLDDYGRLRHDREILRTFRLSHWGFAAAASSSRVAVASTDWLGAYFEWAHGADQFGRSLGPGTIIGPAPGQGSSYADIILWPDVTATLGGFAAAWVQCEDDCGIALRDLSPSARPSGPATLVHEEPGRPMFDVQLAELEHELLIVFAIEWGDAQGIYLLRRDPQGNVGNRIRLTSGRDRSYLLRIAAADDRLAVLYEDNAFAARKAFRFAEFDKDGNPVGPVRNLTEEFGFDVMSDPVYGDTDLIWNAKSGRYALTWFGSGPEGTGIYLLPIRPHD